MFFDRWISKATFRRSTFKWIADEQEFKKLLKRVTDLVALKTSSEIAATTVSLESPTTGTRSGAGLSELKLAQARKYKVQDELYEAFGTTKAEQDTTFSLVVPTDLAHSFLGLDLLDHVLLYVRSRVQIYPIPLVYLQHMKDSFRSESGVRPLDMSTHPPQVAREFAEQDKRLYIAVYDKLSQGLKDRVDNTHSFNQNHPKITIQGGVKKNRGLDLIYSLVFTHMESHGALESRIRASIYSYHLALKSQPLLELVERIRGDLALARKHAVRLSWTESGSKWYSVVSSRSIILGNAMAPFGPQGDRRRDMLDPQDCLQTLFELADVIENSTHLAEQAEGATVGAAFHVRHPAHQGGLGLCHEPSPLLLAGGQCYGRKQVATSVRKGG